MKRPALKTYLGQILLTLICVLLFGGLTILLETVLLPGQPQWAEFRKGWILLTGYVISMPPFALLVFGHLFPKGKITRLSSNLVGRCLLAFLILDLAGTWIAGRIVGLLSAGQLTMDYRQYYYTGFFMLLLGFPIFLFMAMRDIWLQSLEKIQQQELARERLEKQLLEARLKALQMQIHPHFLFNTLNSIASLISLDAVRAETMVEQLASFFRYVLDTSRRPAIALKEELAIIKDYLEIEKVRLGKRLSYTIECDSELAEFLIPTLLLQPLVENTIHHGIAQLEAGGNISLRVEGQPQGIRIEIINDMPSQLKKPIRPGVGLGNIESRGQQFYGEGFHFSFGPMAPGHYKASLDLPLPTSPPL